MVDIAKYSLINRASLISGVVMMLAIVNMLASYLIAESAENDAVRINLAGSLRMQSYRIIEALLIQHDDTYNPTKKDLLQTRIDDFDSRFYHPVLKGHIKSDSYPVLAKAMDDLESNWKTLKLQLNSQTLLVPDILSQIDKFVTLIDALVRKLELQTESKFKLLRMIQGISLLVTIIIVVLGYVYISSNVVIPLKRLIQMAQNIQEGDFSKRANVKGDDELSLLSRTFNDMSENLGAMYYDLEQTVREKTLHLEQVRDGLSLLYDTSRILSSEAPVVERIEKSLTNVSLCLPMVMVAVDLALEGQETFRLTIPGRSFSDDAEFKYTFTLSLQGQVYGELLVSMDSSISSEHQYLLQTIADNMAVALNADWQQGQQHRLVLMEERAVIARELHDSLAQSLSYLKIQFSRMQMLKAKGGKQDAIDSTIQDIKTGIDAAYCQLRELLATFRLQLLDVSLQGALEKTVAEFSDRGDMEITLNYNLINFPLTPNEEIHILQIVRESLSNVVRHANASMTEIIVDTDDKKQVRVRVRDNGQGFEVEPAEGIGANHYGKIIMQERAKTLGGDIVFSNLNEGGALVELMFVPCFMKNSS